MIKAKINELFVSLQGEGPYVGVRQAFIRFAGCNLKCRYCDTDYSAKETADNTRLLDFVKQAGKIHSVVLTGGEPLVQSKFLRGFLPVLKKSGYRVFLETNGVLLKEFQSLAGYMDIISMDIKMPSITGQAACWDEHEKFIKIARKNKKELFVKIVVNPYAEEREIDMLINLLKKYRRKLTVVLQPEHEYVRNRILLEKMESWQQRISVVVRDVRIIPQVHKLMEIK
jgi:7-carboxy-7-deazaguanine synthase